LVQEEIIRNIKYGVTTRSHEEEDHSLVFKGKDAKGRKALGELKST